MLSNEVKKELEKLGYNEQEIKLFNRKQMRFRRENFLASVEYLAQEYIKK